jgi:hypothetical protein
MPDWSLPSPDAEVLAALEAIEAPSRPGPLPGSRRVTADTWAIDRSPREVLAAYQAPGAPIPAGATAAIEGDVLVIRAPFSTTALFVSDAPSGCHYRLVPGPTLRITGGGERAPQGTFFTIVGIQAVNPMDGTPQPTLFTAPRVGDQPWVLFIARDDDSGRMMAICLKGTYTDLQRASGDEGTADVAVPATLELTPYGATARFELGGSAVTVDARRTHSLQAALTAAGAFTPPAPRDPTLQVTCVTKRASSTLDRRIAAVGGHDAHGKPWRLDADELVARIEAGQAYGIGDADDPVDIFVTTGTSGTRYPKAAGEGQNALLHLPKCRALKS